MVLHSKENEDKVSRGNSVLNNEKRIPVFTLSVEQLEPIIKSWIRDCIEYGPVTQTNNLPKYLTRVEAARVLQISLPTLHSYTQLGLIPAKRIGTRVLYSEAELQDALKDIPSKLSRR
jgi:excisionase family DNA binding protein